MNIPRLLLAVVAALSLPILSPAQRALAPGQTARLMTLSVEGTDPREVYVSKDAIIEAPNWTPDGKWLVFNGSGALWRVPADGSAQPEKIPLGNLQGANNDHVLSPDGRTIYLSARGKLYSVPLEGGQPRQISNDPPAGQPFTYWLHGVSPDGKTLVYTGAKQIGDDRWAKTDIWTIPATGGPDRALTDDTIYDDGPEYSPDGQWIYFNSERASTQKGHAQIFRMKTDGTGVEQITQDERVNWFPHLSPDGKWIVYLSFPPGTLGHPANKDIILRRMRPDGSERRDLIAFNGGQGTINVPSWSPDSRRFAFVAYPYAETPAAAPAPKSASAAPPAAKRPDVSAGVKKFLDVPYVTGGGERQTLDLYVPTTVKNPPLVMSVHGGGWRQGDKLRPRGLTELLEAGIAVATINYRLSSQAQFPAQLEDAKAAVRWLRANAARHGYDSARIGAWGGSAGGHLVALLGTTGGVKEFDVGENFGVSSAVQAVANWYGPTDFLQMDAQLPADMKGMKHDIATSPESLLIGGLISAHPDRVRRANPITYLGSAKDVPPFQIFHGEADTSVPVGQSRILAAALTQSGASVEFETIPGDGHGLRENGARLVPRTVAFFAKHLATPAP